MQNNEDNNEEGGRLESLRKVRDDAMHVESSHHLHGVWLLQTLDISCPKALE